MSRIITVNRRVISYEPVEVDILEFLKSCEAELIPMHETKSLEIRLPSKCEYYTNYVGYIKFSDLLYDLQYTKILIRDGKTHVVFANHVDVIHLSDHLLTNSMVTIEK